MRRHGREQRVLSGLRRGCQFVIRAPAQAEEGLHRSPSIEPPKKPPMAELYASSFCLRFAEAVLVNSYAPPTAAVSHWSAFVPFFPPSLSICRTEYRNRPSSTRENAECADILLREDVLDRGDEGARGAGDEGGLDRGGDGVFGHVKLLYLPFLRHLARSEEVLSGD